MHSKRRRNDAAFRRNWKKNKNFTMAMNNDRMLQGPKRPLGLLYSKKGFEMPFHWIFILIAGAIILGFFFSIAYKQQNISQERLQLTLASEIENIFTGAIAGRGIAQSLSIPPQGIEFECTEGCACEFRVKKAARQFGVKSIFAPKLLEDRSLFVWSVAWKQPYRTTNFLLLTNPKIKYYLVYDNSNAFSKSLLEQITKKIPPPIRQRGVTLTEFNYDKISLTEMSNVEERDYQHTKFVMLNVEPSSLDASFRRASTSGVKIDDKGRIGFYEKDGVKLRLLKHLSYTGLPTIFAAIFSEDHTMYECGLRTAFRKLAHVSQLYAQRAATLQEKAFGAEKVWCTYGATSYTGNVCDQVNPATVIGMLCDQNRIAKELANNLDDTNVRALVPLSDHLYSQNRNFLQQSCPELF